MSLFYTEGFDLYTVSADMAPKWANRITSGNAPGGGTSHTETLTMVPGRFGIGSGFRTFSTLHGAGANFDNTSSAYADAIWPTDTQTFFVGFAMNLQSPLVLPAITQWISLMDSIGNVNLDLRLSSGFNPSITRNGTTLCTATRTLPPNTWTYFEIAATISATAGWCELWMDGVLVASYYGTNANRAASNGNTQNGSPSVRQMRVGPWLNGTTKINDWTNDAYWDDMYVCTNAGGVNNNVLGDVRIATLLPSGPGNYSQWTRGGTNSGANWSQVEEVPANGDTDYVYSNQVGQIDTYQYTDLPVIAAAVKGVIAQFQARKDDAGVRWLQAVVREGTTDAFVASPVNLVASYQVAGIVMDLNPTTNAAWTPADVNAAEFGVRVQS